MYLIRHKWYVVVDYIIRRLSLSAIILKMYIRHKGTKKELTLHPAKDDPCTVSVTPSQLCTFFRKRTISTWKISNLHVAIFYSPRRRKTIPPKFHLIPPKFYFAPTWRIFFSHVGISKSPRGDHSFPTQRRINMYPALNYCNPPTLEVAEGTFCQFVFYL